MHSELKSLSRTGGVPEENRRGPEPERGDAETRALSPFLSRRFVIGSLVAFGILVANAFVTYRTIANLIEASRIAENTLKVVEALKDVQGDIADSQIDLRGYIIGEERARFDTLIEIHRRNGVAATIRNIRATAGPATIHRILLLTAELLGAADAR